MTVTNIETNRQCNNQNDANPTLKWCKSKAETECKDLRKPSYMPRIHAINKLVATHNNRPINQPIIDNRCSCIAQQSKATITTSNQLTTIQKVQGTHHNKNEPSDMTKATIEIRLINAQQSMATIPISNQLTTSQQAQWTHLSKHNDTTDTTALHNKAMQRLPHQT